MAPTTVTTIVMVVFALAVVGMGLYNLFGSWEPVPRRISERARLEREYERAVREMHAYLDEYERGERPL
jgi:hypothetical protein